MIDTAPFTLTGPVVFNAGMEDEFSITKGEDNAIARYMHLRERLQVEDMDLTLAERDGILAEMEEVRKFMPDWWV